MARPRPLPGPDAGQAVPARPRWFRSWRFRAPGRRWRIAGLVVLALLVLAIAGSYLIQEPLRRTIEHQMNERMTGYSARIERLTFHPIGLGLTLYGLTMTQDAHPDPPVLDIARLQASVEWKALLHARLVANFRVERPRLHVDLQHIQEEARDPTPVDEHGWQDAFQAIYPLKINEIVITDGEATYVDPGPFKPLRIDGIQARIENIRNVHSRERDYPSAIDVQAVVFESGRLRLEGNADFLAEPFPGVKASVGLEGVPLDYFRPVTDRYNVRVRGGTLSVAGVVEYAPTIKVVDLRDAEIRGVTIDYIHTPAKEGVARQATKATAEATKEAADRPDLLVRAERVRVTESEVGIVNRTASPAFRVFLTGVNLEVENVTNQRAEGVGRIGLTGRFMGSGRTDVTMAVRPDPKGPDFDLTLAIEDTDMTAMNPILRQYGKFDVVAGRFSLFSELQGKNGRITGYVKPLFRDVKAYDPEQDRDKGFFRRLYERLVSGVAKVLRNEPREEVATQVRVEGRIDDPRTSTLQAIGNLLRNAFIEAILPGLERQMQWESSPQERARR